MRIFCVGLLLLACGPRDIVVVDLPASEDGGFQGHNMHCSAASECASNEFCEKPSCGAVEGDCRPRPPFCMPELKVVCGCNGVNYWNDCLRKQQGLSAIAEADQCSNPAACSATAPCADPAASCTFLLPSAASCSSVSAGVCWIAPANCPPPTGQEGSWESCAGTPVCGGFCAAIHSGAPRRNVNSCP